MCVSVAQGQKLSGEKQLKHLKELFTELWFSRIQYENTLTKLGSL